MHLCTKKNWVFQKSIFVTRSCNKYCNIYNRRGGNVFNVVKECEKEKGLETGARQVLSGGFSFFKTL